MQAVRVSFAGSGREDVAGRRAPAARCRCAFQRAFRLDECNGEDHDGEENRDKRFGVAGDIKVDHGVFRPFTLLDASPPGKVYRVTDLS